MMQNPNIKTKVVHSQSKPAWNVVGTTPGMKFKIARFPYETSIDPQVDTRNKYEALLHAHFVSRCFNQSEEIITTFNF